MGDNKVKVFVTGASGFIGREICSTFLEDGYFVCALSRQNDPDSVPAGVTLIEGDLVNVDSWRDQVGDVDIVVHCAGNARLGNGPEYIDDNVIPTKNLLRVCSESIEGLSRFIFISSIAAGDRPFGDNCVQSLREDSPDYPTTDYGKSKKEAEELVKASELPYVVIRPSQVVGETMPLQESLFGICELVYSK